MSKSKYRVYLSYSKNATIEVEADDKEQAANLAIERVGECTDVDVEKIELADENPEEEYPQTGHIMLVNGAYFKMIVPDKRSGFFKVTGTDENWWTNGHIMIHVYDDPPENIRGNRKSPDFKAAWSMFGNPDKETIVDSIDVGKTSAKLTGKYSTYVLSKYIDIIFSPGIRPAMQQFGTGGSIYDPVFGIDESNNEVISIVMPMRM
jgi:hypothetical protein